MLTDAISTALASVATGIIVLWGALVAALTALVLGIVGALSSAATIFGLPASPFIAAGAAAVACAAVIAGGMNLESVFPPRRPRCGRRSTTAVTTAVTGRRPSRTEQREEPRT